MVIVGAFLGGYDATLEAGKASISLSIMTRDRQNLDTASWTVTAQGFSQTVQADASGRGYIIVPAGKTYTVTLSHQGAYANDGPQSVITENKMNYGVLFDLADYTSKSNTVLKVVTYPNITVNITQIGDQITYSEQSNELGNAIFIGLQIGTDWKVSSPDVAVEKIVSIESELNEVKLMPTVYGVKIKRAEADPYNRVEYIDDAIGMTPAKGRGLGSWANTELFSSLIKPVVRLEDGTFKDLDKRDITKCTDGSPSNIDKIGNDAFTEFPAWYMSMSRDGEYMYIRICSSKLDDTYYAYHAMDNGVLRNCFHVGDFGGTLSGGKIYSIRGKTPSRNMSIINAISYCQARGKSFDMYSWYVYNFIACLYLIAYKSTDSQTALGEGYTGGSSITSETRTTFDNDFGLAGSTSNTEQMSFLWIQNLWGNMSYFVGGHFMSKQGEIKTILDGNDVSCNDADYSLIGHAEPGMKNASGYISEMDCRDARIGFIPSKAGASETTYFCDNGRGVPTGFFAKFGSSYGAKKNTGMFSIETSNVATDYPNNYDGCRLIYKGGRP